MRDRRTDGATKLASNLWRKSDETTKDEKMENKHANLSKTLSRQSEEGRNFRSTYYEKVGFRGVEERKSILLILNEKPIDRLKLLQFTQRFALPADFRFSVWKLLLDVVASDVNKETETRVKEEQKQVCITLQESLKAIRCIDENSPSREVFVLMFLLEKGKLKYDFKRQLEDSELIDLVCIADNFDLVDGSFEENYWLFRNFCIQKRDHRQMLLNMAEKLHTNLSIDDVELDSHLKSTKANEILPIALWFSRLYSGILHRDSLIKIFDKIIAGLYKILPLTAQIILLTLKPHLIVLSSPNDIRAKLLMPLTFDCSEVIVGKVLDNCN